MFLWFYPLLSTLMIYPTYPLALRKETGNGNERVREREPVSSGRQVDILLQHGWLRAENGHKTTRNDQGNNTIMIYYRKIKPGDWKT